MDWTTVRQSAAPKIDASALNLIETGAPGSSGGCVVFCTSLGAEVCDLNYRAQDGFGHLWRIGRTAAYDDREATGRSVYIGKLRDGEDVEADEDAQEAELTISGGPVEV